MFCRLHVSKIGSPAWVIALFFETFFDNTIIYIYLYKDCQIVTRFNFSAGDIFFHTLRALSPFHFSFLCFNLYNTFLSFSFELHGICFSYFFLFHFFVLSSSFYSTMSTLLYKMRSTATLSTFFQHPSKRTVPRTLAWQQSQCAGLSAGRARTSKRQSWGARLHRAVKRIRILGASSRPCVLPRWWRGPSWIRNTARSWSAVGVYGN